MVSEFKDLTVEAIYDAITKMVDSKPINHPIVYSHADIHTAIAAGREAERERIIKLLEKAQVTEVELFDGRTIKVPCESVRADLLIALIKGENK